MSDYDDYLTRRAQIAHGGGFDPGELPEWLFPFQRDLVAWALTQGRSAIFADCGLGKTPMELVWADRVSRHTGRPVLIATPLAVGFQFEREAAKFDIAAKVSRTGQAHGPITVTNYERLDRFDPADFAGMVCDESSAIKSFDGQRREVVTEFMRRMPFRLLGTATAAPNDYIELGTSSEALGILGHIDMLNRWFTNKEQSSAIRKGFRGGKADAWRFKGHAEEPFWRWVSSWARAIRKPSDYGYGDDEFVLPRLTQRTTVVEARTLPSGVLFDVPAQGLAEERQESRRTIAERCEAAAAALTDAPAAVAWCHLNDESTLLTRLVDGAVELTGSASVDEKEDVLRAFSDGDIRVLVTKPRIGAWGLNWQHCHRMTYFPSHSYEQFYQAVRRSWRFGQRHEVIVDVITTKGGEQVLANLNRKAAQADRMFDALLRHMTDALRLDQSAPMTKKIEVPAWLA